MKLYQLTNEYKQTLDDLLSIEELLPEEAFHDTLEGLQGEIKIKAINVAAYIKNLEAEQQAIAEAATALKKRQETKQKHIARLESYLLHNLISCGINKIDSTEIDLSVRENPPSVNIRDESVLPKNYIKIKTVEQPDKIAIKNDLLAGVEVPGAEIIKTKRLVISV